MDIVTLGAALNGSAEYVNSHFRGGSNIQIVDNPDGTQTINASGEVSSKDTVARAEIAAIKDGETLDSFGDVETALEGKADTTDIPTVPITAIQKNGTGITPVSGTVNITVPTQASDINAATATQGGKADTAIQGIKVNSSTVNPDSNNVVSITVPTSAADVSALPNTTKYAAALSLTINSSTYVMTGQLKDQNGDNLGTAQTIDLPLESVVVGGSYNSQTKKVVLTLQNGNTVEFSVADLVSGLQTELSASNKLNPAYINYDSTHRAVSDTEKSTWNDKQNAIDSSHKLSADLIDDTDATNKFATEAELEQIEANKNNILSIQNGTYWEEYMHGNLFTIATDKISNSYYYYNTNTNKIVINTSSNLSCFILKVDKNTDYVCDAARFLLHMSSKEDVTSSEQYVTTFNSGNDEYVAISYDHNNYPNYEISKGNKTESGEITYEIPWLYHPLPVYKNGIIQTTALSVASGNTNGIPERYDLQRNYTIECTCDFETFGGIEIFKGSSGSTYLSRLIIDSTNYTVYNGTTKIVEAAHGLTFDDYITVVIVYKDTGNATIKINTSTGSFSVDNISWYGYGGKANFKSTAGTYTNMVLSIKSLDFNKPVSIFGDSYVNTRNNERWLYYLKELGFDQYLISGFPGVGSAAEIQSFRNVIAKTNPKIVLWALGMNDGSDTTTYPDAWKSAIDEVIETCDKNGIELVLATIPCVPSINNAYKNAYVKSTGKRYIDFAKAVGAETSGSTWYTGMLSSDNVHPTALGANALAAQAMIDMPEIMGMV